MIDDSMDDQKQFLSIEIGGKDETLWKKLRNKFEDAINSLLDTVINDETNASIRDEAKKFTSALLDYGKSKLNKPGIDNEKTIAEIDLLYSQKQKVLSETRKTNAEAISIELSNKMKSMKFTLAMYKMFLLGEGGDKELLFIKSIDAFMETIKMIESKDFIE